jgi:hypothetical protein
VSDAPGIRAIAFWVAGVGGHATSPSLPIGFEAARAFSFISFHIRWKAPAGQQLHSPVRGLHEVKA